MEEDRLTRITLRIPKELHGKIAAAADAATHSQNAEIVSRLENSFAPQQQNDHAFIELMVSNMQSQVEMLTLRISMAKMRMQAEVDRVHSLSKEIALGAKSAQTDEEFERVDDMTARLSAHKKAIVEVEAELTSVLRERELVLQQLDNARRLVESARSAAESRLHTQIDQP